MSFLRVHKEQRRNYFFFLFLFSTSVVLRSLKVLSVTSGHVSESFLRQLRSGPHPYVQRMDPPIIYMVGGEQISGG